MAHIAIIHIPDHTAEAIINQSHTLEYIYGARVVGLFVYPARRDSADHPNCFLNGKQPWVRDRLGFMKCGVCGKRNKRVRRFLINSLFDLLGANLYPKAPAAFRTPEGYGDSPR
jgi:hypothetical protein